MQGQERKLTSAWDSLMRGACSLSDARAYHSNRLLS